MPNYSKKKFSGITLVELLIVVGIVSIISLAIIPSYADFSQKKDFNNKVEVLIAEIMNVRNKALSGAVLSDGTEVLWSIQPADNCRLKRYFLGYRRTIGENFVIQSEHYLPDGVEFSTASGECGEILFERLRGTPVPAGTALGGSTVASQNLVLKYRNLTRTIMVNSSGRISYD